MDKLTESECWCSTCGVTTTVAQGSTCAICQKIFDKYEDSMPKFYKNSLVNQKAIICYTCYGFSNWAGDREVVVYEDRDCASCKVNPDIYPEFAEDAVKNVTDKEHDGLTR